VIPVHFAPEPPIRTECPPGVCDCERDVLLADADSDQRILRLTQLEEKRLIARIEALASYADLLKLQQKMRELLGIELRIEPGPREVRTVRGLQIELATRPGLCRKTRKTIPAAVRKCLESHPEIVYALLNSHDLLG
jgi:hypothetical protein